MVTNVAMNKLLDPIHTTKLQSGVQHLLCTVFGSFSSLRPAALIKVFHGFLLFPVTKSGQQTLHSHPISLFMSSYNSSS
jgi:hypothetical protein